MIDEIHSHYMNNFCMFKKYFESEFAILHNQLHCRLETKSRQRKRCGSNMKKR